MQCVKTGQAARFENDTYYPGDRFQCPVCLTEVLKCTGGSHHAEEDRHEDPLEMRRNVLLEDNNAAYGIIPP